jgi:alpha-glucosidase (family GH31 glycosyl hydrolase)
LPGVKRIASIAAIVAAAGSCSSKTAEIPPPIVLTTPAMTVTIGSPGFTLEVKNARGEVVLRSFTNGTNAAYSSISVTHRTVQFRTHIIEGWDYQTAGDAAAIWTGAVVRSSHTDHTASIDLDDGRNGIATAHVEIAIDGSELKVDAQFAGKWPPNAVDDDAPPGLNLASMAFELPRDEHFYGLGEHLVSVDHRGRSMYSWVEEGGIGLGEQAPPGPNNPSPNGPSMAHTPIPFFLSTSGYSAWQDTGFRTGNSFGDEVSEAWRLWAFEPALHLHFFVRDDPKDSISDFTAKTGRARLPAPWVFGPRRRMDSGGKVMGVNEYELLRQKNVPCTTADDAMHFLPIGSEVGREVELTAWTASLHAMGFKVLCYYNAYVSTNDPRAAADRDEGRAKNYFVKMEDGSEFDTFMISAGPQTVATIDYTNPAAVAWYGTLLQRSIDIGYDGFMLDFGEYLPPKAKMFDGRSGWEVHNLFPVLYQKATWDYMNSKKGADWEFFARAGYTGTQGVIPMHWSGDPAASFDDAKGLPAQVRAGINAGLSGIPFWGSDMTGYTCLNDPPADKDVFLRWVEFAALSPDMHEENACSGTMPQQKWTLWSDAETTQVYGDYARLHTRLFPYLYAAAKEAADTGIPIMRHPMLMHPDVAQAQPVELEYYFGSSLYVAPVVRRQATSRSFWLPPGKWVDWWTFDALASGMVVRNAGLTVLPLFLKSGGIVPMLDPTIMTLAPATDASVVTLEKVAGVLDVRAAVDLTAPSGSTKLVDGTTLSTMLAQGAVTLPNGITMAPDEATLSTCSGCGLIEMLPGGATRVRITTPSEAQGSLTAGALTLAHGGTTQRIRWDVAVIP